MKDNHRRIKDLLYEQVARVTRALASPKRLEIVEVLSQGEKTVESLAQSTDLDIRLASAHLKQLKAARLVESRKEGRYVHYRLADEAVASLWVSLRTVAEGRLAELQKVIRDFVNEPRALAPLDRRAMLAKARDGEVIVIDVRPESEYVAAHLPFARSVPLDELKRRLAELPRGSEIVAYCRGPFCMFANDAVAFLRAQGYEARRIDDGVAEWRASGMPLESGGAAT
jgi:DNA-binding transcriptional ArsR family regulator/rhodanese-related sulfurtransferase